VTVDFLEKAERDTGLDFSYEKGLLLAQLEAKAALKAAKKLEVRQSEPIRSFLSEFENRFVWNLVPTSFLYDLYKAWYSPLNLSGELDGRNTFKNQLKQLLEQDSQWAMAPGNIRTAGKMTLPELLILEYNLVNWKNKSYAGEDVNQICVPTMPEQMRGIVRRVCKIVSIRSIPTDCGVVD